MSELDDINAANKLDIIPGPGKEGIDVFSKPPPNGCQCVSCRTPSAEGYGRGLADAKDREATEQTPGFLAPAELPTDAEDLKECCFETRDRIEEVKKRLRGLLHNHPAVMPGATYTKPPDTSGANIALAYRHLEDACMRLGKAVQALDGGKSVYPR